MRRALLFLSALAIAAGLCLRTPAQSSISVPPGWLTYLGTGAGGAYTCSPGPCPLADEQWFSSFTVPAGVTVFNGSGNGPTIIRSTGACTIAGTVGNGPNTQAGVGTTTLGDFGGGGGGGGAGATAAGKLGRWTVGNGLVEISTGGNPGVAPGGVGGSGGIPVVTQYRSLLIGGSFWPGGGSIGGAGGGPFGGPPGAGGGAIIFVCNSINFTGTIDVSGGAGGPPTANNSGAGGGGGAGYVILSANTFVANTGTINTAGGAGGSCGSFKGCGAGGSGGSGWNVAVQSP